MGGRPVLAGAFVAAVLAASVACEPLPPPAVSPTPTPTPVPVPRLVLPAEEAALGDVPRGTPVTLTVEVQNSGDAALHITGVDGPPFAALEAPVGAVPPGGRAVVEIAVDTSQAGPRQGDLRFRSDDPHGDRVSVRVSMNVLAVSFSTRERTDRYLETVSTEAPIHVRVEEGAREGRLEFRWPVLLAYEEDWTLRVRNDGPGKASGTLTARVNGGGISDEEPEEFTVPSGATEALQFELDHGFFLQRFRSRRFSHALSNLREQVERERQVVDVVMSIGERSQVVDTFVAGDPRARLWRPAQYFRPGPLTYHLALDPKPADPKTTPTPTPAPVDFELLFQPGTPVVDRGLFGAAITVDVFARLINTGDFDATNVRVQVAASVEGRPLPVNDADPYVEQVGTMPARATVERTVPIRLVLGPLEGMAAERSGIDFVVQVLSDQRVEDPVTFRCGTTACR